MSPFLAYRKDDDIKKAGEEGQTDVTAAEDPNTPSLRRSSRTRRSVQPFTPIEVMDVDSDEDEDEKNLKKDSTKGSRKSLLKQPKKTSEKEPEKKGIVFLQNSS